MKWWWQKDKTYEEKIEDTTEPTEEEIQAFKSNVEIIIRAHLEVLLVGGKFNTVDDFLMQVPTKGKTPTYVLLMLLEVANPYRDNLQTWTAFVNRVEFNAVQRDEFNDGLFDKFRKE